MKTHAIWTNGKVEKLKELYPNMLNRDIAKKLGFSLKSIQCKAFRLGLKKTKEFIAMTGVMSSNNPQTIATRFKKGHQTWNKGMHFISGGRSAETRFKKGERPKNWQPIGAESMRDGYLCRKISDTGVSNKDYVGVHILMWQESFKQKISAGHVVVFKDGNKSNLIFENLELVTRAELMRRNNYQNILPPELAKLVQLKGALNRQINRLTKEKEKV